MNVADSVQFAIDEFSRGHTDAAVLHACNAVDGTARKRYPQMGSRRRFETFLRDQYWILGPMVLPGIDLRTRFVSVPQGADENGLRPDIATVIYKIHRCTHGHGDELPERYSLLPAVTVGRTTVLIGQGILHLPDSLPFGLIAAAVVAEENRGQRVPDGYYFSLDGVHYEINDWWGREKTLRSTVERHDRIEVLMDFGDWDPANAPG